MQNRRNVQFFGLILQYLNEGVLFFFECSKAVFLKDVWCARDAENLIHVVFLGRLQAGSDELLRDTFALKVFFDGQAPDFGESLGVHFQRAASDDMPAFRCDKKCAGARKVILHQLVRVLSDEFEDSRHVFR